MITINPYGEENQEAALDCLRAIYPDDVQSRQYFVLTKAFSYVARTTHDVVGVASRWENPVHPDALRCTVAVHPNYRKMGVGSRLFGAITHGHEDRPLVTSLWDTQTIGNGFAKSRGFYEFRRTHTVSLRLSDLDLSAIKCQSIPNADYRICALSDMPTRRDREAVAALSKEIYASTHQDNPPADESVKRWMVRVFTDDLVETGSLVVNQEGHPVAMALLYRGKHPNVLEMGWRGASGTNWITGQAYVETLSWMQVEYAVATGAEVLILESDSTDPWSEGTRRMFPFTPATAWITMKRT